MTNPTDSLIPKSRLEQMEAHMDEGGKFTHENAVELLQHIRQHEADMGASGFLASGDMSPGCATRKDVRTEAPTNTSEISVSKREAELESCLIDCIQILNAIRARDGTYGDFSLLYFNDVVEQGHRLLGGDSLVAMWKRDAATREPVAGKQAVRRYNLLAEIHSMIEKELTADAAGVKYVD